MIHEVATGRERIWPEPHTHLTGWLPTGDSIIGWQHDPAGSGRIITICRVADGSCRAVARGETPKWSAADSRIYFTKPATERRQLWSVSMNGNDERLVADLGSFQAIAVLFDVSRTGVLVWAPLQPGRQELWTATLTR